MVYFWGHRSFISTKSWSQFLFTYFFLLWRLNLVYLRSRWTITPSSDFFFSQVFLSCDWNQMSLAWVAIQLTKHGFVPKHQSCTDCSQQQAWQLCWLWYRFLLCLSPEAVQLHGTGVWVDKSCWMPELFVCRISLGMSVVVMEPRVFTVWRYCVHSG